MEGKTAILGGTFNPIHNGHLSMAQAALNEYGLSRVIFLPNGNPPHKNSSDMPDAETRYKMVSLAISGNNAFDISDYEIKQDKPSYTIETLPYLKSVYGDNIYFIIGADSLYTLHKWKSHERLIKECGFIVADRHCKEGSDVYEECETLRRRGANIHLLSMPYVDVTSTDVRECIRTGREFKHYLPPKVYEYIKTNKLYQSCSEDENDN